jgi:hypothetical protein
MSFAGCDKICHQDLKVHYSLNNKDCDVFFCIFKMPNSFNITYVNPFLDILMKILTFYF